MHSYQKKPKKKRTIAGNDDSRRTLQKLKNSKNIAKVENVSKNEYVDKDEKFLNMLKKATNINKMFKNLKKMLRKKLII